MILHTSSLVACYWVSIFNLTFHFNQLRQLLMTPEVFAQKPYHCQYISPIFILHIYNVVLWSNCHLLMLVIASRLTANSGFSQSGKNGSTTYWANVKPWNYITVLSKDYVSWYSSLSMKAVEMIMSSFITYEHTVAYKSSSHGEGGDNGQ